MGLQVQKGLTGFGLGDSGKIKKVGFLRTGDVSRDNSMIILTNV